MFFKERLRLSLTLYYLTRYRVSPSLRKAVSKPLNLAKYFTRFRVFCQGFLDCFFGEVA